MILAVPQGTVLFSTMIAPLLAFFAMVRVADSSAPKSALAPAPTPYILVGVLTQMKIISAVAMHGTTLVEKNRFGFLDGRWMMLLDEAALMPLRPVTVVSLVPSRAMRTILGRPVSWMGRWLEFHAAILSELRSTTLTVIEGL